ncbi:MAG: response regulator [Deltaproteobacteria bacterium]|nr:response regulator [Deltaproteobacteria bacterium]
MAHSLQPELLDLRDLVDHLREEVRVLRAALADNGSGRVLQQQAEEFSRLLSVSKLIVSELDLGRVYDLVASRAREIVCAETVLLPMLNAGRDQYTYAAAAGDDADAVRGSTFPAHVGMCGWVLQHGRTLLFGENSTQWMAEPTPWEAGQQSAVLVPLVGRKGIIGGLSALGKQGGGCFTQHDLDLLTMFANQVSIAIENARLFQDVTREVDERRQAEERQRTSEQFVRTILDTIDEGLIVVDHDFRVRVANRAYGARLPHAQDPVLGAPCYALAHESTRPCFEDGVDCPVRRVFLDGQPHRALHRHAARDGRVLFVETKAFPLKDPSGRVTSAIELVADITERFQLEEERIRTQKLEAVGTLAGGIAHDFNNLLQGVFGFVSLAKLQMDDKDKALGTLEEAEKALRMSVKLTNQLLTFSKGGKPARMPIDLLPIVENAAQFTLSGSRSHHTVTTDDGPWRVDADEGQIYQVFQNIILNADQAMPQGGEVAIALRKVQAPGEGVPPSLRDGRYVRVDIKDTGAGIPDADRPKIFDPYFTTKEKGSGLGLATSYSIVSNHGGGISVESRQGAGATFSVFLPATPAPATAEPVQPAAAVAPGRAGRVLVMDDEQVIRTVVGALLRKLGHRVEEAAHGQEALEKYQAARQAGDPFDLVILDLTIRGGMGGAETMKKLMEIDPQVTALVSSGYSDDAGIAGYEARGFKGFLKKPYDIKTLREVLQRLLPQ